MYDFPIFEEVHRERSQRICELFALIMQLISVYVFFVGIFPRRTIFRCCCRLLCVRRKGSVDFVGVCCISWNAVSGRSSDIPICSQLCCAALKLLYFFLESPPSSFLLHAIDADFFASVDSESPLLEYLIEVFVV